MNATFEIIPVGVVMNGVSGRMGTNQHLLRSIVAIRDQGGIRLADGRRIMPTPTLVGRNRVKLAELADRAGGVKWTTELDEALGRRNHVRLLRFPNDGSAI